MRTFYLNHLQQCRYAQFLIFSIYNSPDFFFFSFKPKPAFVDGSFKRPESILTPNGRTMINNWNQTLKTEK